MKTIDTGPGSAADAGVPTTDTLPRAAPTGPLNGSAAATDGIEHNADASQRLGRLTGVLYLVIAALGMFAGSVSTGLVVPGDPAATAEKALGSLALVRASLAAWIVVLAADIAVAATLFVLLKPVGATLSLLAASFRLVYAAIQGVNLLNLFNAVFVLTDPRAGSGSAAGQANALALFSLEAFGTGFRLGLTFFGLHLLVLGYLFFASRYVPWVIGVLVVAAGIGYSADSVGRFFVPGYSALATALLLTPATIGELALTLWLLVRGIDLRQGAATGPSLGARSISADTHTTQLRGATGGIQ